MSPPRRRLNRTHRTDGTTADGAMDITPGPHRASPLNLSFGRGLDVTVSNC